jgi:excisionase family DNA binding protein
MPKSDPSPMLLRLTEVATMIGFSRRWLEMQVAEGLAPAVRVGRSVRMRRADVEAFARDGKWPEGKAGGTSPRPPTPPQSLLATPGRTS